MKIYRLEQVRLEPLVVIADNFDDAARIFLEGLEHGLGKRVTASFAVSAWKLKQGNARDILHDFASQGLKGLVWPTEEGWELVVPHSERD